jgi:TM2 domain-containing membrane protein YozV
MTTNLERKLQLDTQKLVLFDSELRKKQKGTLAAYALWYFLGGFGAHRFYIGRKKSAIVQAILVLIGAVAIFTAYAQILPDLNMLDTMSDQEAADYFAQFAWVVPFLVITIIGGIWVIVDAFLLYKWVRNHNDKVEEELLTTYGV